MKVSLGIRRMGVWTYGHGPGIRREGGGEQILRMRTATADLWSPVGTFPCAPPILTTIINLKINCLHSEVHVFFLLPASLHGIGLCCLLPHRKSWTGFETQYEKLNLSKKSLIYKLCKIQILNDIGSSTIQYIAGNLLEDDLTRLRL